MGPVTGISGIGGTRLAPRPIRGRADELKQIGALMAALAQGHGGVLVIEGPPGIGKSRLLAEVLELAAKGDARVLFGEAFEYQQSVPFFSLFTATLRADPPVGDPEALRALGGSADVSYWVVHDLQRAIAAAAEETPLVIVLEDIHWADNGTLLALRSLATARPDLPLLWVLTVRTGAGGPAVQETLTVLRRSGAAVLRVPAMSPDAVTEMVQDAVRANADDTLLNLAVKAHGNPFLVMELVGGLAEEGRLDVSGGRAATTGANLPRRLAASMQQRLDVLSSDTSELVRVASVLPDRFSAALVAAMLDRRPASLMTALAEAVRADLLVDDGEELRFAHDLLREATRQSLPHSLRRAMERQSASIMLGMGAAPAEVATQLIRSADPGDREAIRALRQAAQSVRHSDAGVAADLSRHALALTPITDPERGRLVAETVGLLNHARRYKESEQLAAEALEGASAQEEAEIRLRLPAITGHTSQRRVKENRRALSLSDISEVTRARHMAMLAYNLMLDDADGVHRVEADEAAAAAESAGDLRAAVTADVALACYDCADGYVARALHRLGEICEQARTREFVVSDLLASNHYANMLALAGRLDEAAERVAAGVQRAKHERDEMMLDIWARIAGTIHLAAGRLSAARAGVESLAPPERTDPTEFDMVRTVVLAEVAVAVDDRKLLQQTLSHMHGAHSTGSSMVRQAADYVLALAAWNRGDLHDAARWFGGDIHLFGTPVMPYALDQAIFAARIAAAAGDAGGRAGVLRVVEKLRREEPAIPLFTAAGIYVRGILDSDADEVVTASDLLRQLSRPLLYAAATEDAGRLLAGAGRGDEALDRFNAAFDTYTRLGALAYARRVGRELRKLGVERRIVSAQRATTGWDSLTDAELKVVSLIAEGATNRAVADQLHISLGTVKTHAHNAFTKLGISSRGQLTQFMH
ncbi:AAA family ATPase [Mycolicibacterium boenickei]|nr:AAA family ATPase [Mycolicibacterium boenickei]